MTVRSFSLRVVSLSSVVWYLSVLFGSALILWAAYRSATAPGVESIASLLTIAILVALLELLPLVQGRGHDPQGVVMSTSFSFALLFIWGLWPTVLLVALGSAFADVRMGKAWWKTIFNPAQYALSLGLASMFPLAYHATGSLDHPLSSFRPSDLVWMAGAWLTYFFANLLIVSAVLTFDAPFREVAFADFRHEAMMTMSVLALSPLIVILAQTHWPLIPLLLIPLLMIYYTAQLALEREHEAGHDALTGLPNRTTLEYEVRDALAAYHRGDRPFALMLIDLDDFKTVNDALGHHAGDELLRQFATRVRAALRPEDVVARLGGDEFAVVAFDVDAFESCILAQRMRDRMVEPIELEGLKIEVRFSVGVALCPMHGQDPATLLRRADVAMFRAKGTRTGLELFSAEQDEQVVSRLGLTGELRTALEAGDVELHYQPKLGPSREIIGFEALLRWPHAERGFISPDEFIPLAERSGLMPQLTAHVIDLAIEQMARWRRLDMIFPVAVNISPTDLAGPHLSDTVTAKLAEYDVPAEMLVLEITERVLTDRLDESRNTLQRLRTLGVAISLDDFGTGYSSLMRLSSLPVDEIKIDRAFVAGLLDDPRALGIINALIGLAHSLGVPAIAEGVENEDQHRLLESLHCDGVQGYHIARPMDGDAATTWVREHLAGDAASRLGVAPEPVTLSPNVVPLRRYEPAATLPVIGTDASSR